MTQGEHHPAGFAVSEVAWIGAGKMGAPMACNLIKAGISVSVLDPSSNNREHMAASGATLRDDLHGLRDTEVIFSTIPNDAVLRDLVFGRESEPGLNEVLSSGSTFVEMSTVSPSCSTSVASELASKGIQYLRAPISGSTAMAASADITVLASGCKDAWTKVKPHLDRLSAKQFYLGQGEEARYMKLVLNTLVGATSSILSEALSLGRSGGLTKHQMMDVIGQSAVSSPLLAYKAEAIATDDYTPAFSIDQMIKDFGIITVAGKDSGVPMFVTNLILQQYQAASNVGYQDQDFFSLVDWLQNLSATAD